ncbi:MAG: hypothetical protein ABR533_09530, partial [Desulfonatronovibrio sp.]
KNNCRQGEYNCYPLQAISNTEIIEHLLKKDKKKGARKNIYYFNNTTTIQPCTGLSNSWALALISEVHIPGAGPGKLVPISKI